MALKLEDLGINSRNVLRALAEHPANRRGLADKTGLSVTQISRTLNRLSVFGLINHPVAAGDGWSLNAVGYALLGVTAPEPVSPIAEPDDEPPESPAAEAEAADTDAVAPAAAIAAIAASYLGIGPDCTVLEPSAGRGALATAAYNIEADVTCVEIDKDACTDLRSLGFEVFNFDFLDLTPKALGELCDVPGGKFDAVLMNPPFSKGRDAAHVKHALNFVKRGGRIVAIIAKSFTFRDDRAYAEFRDIFAAHNGTIVRELPEGTFKDAGTNIATYLITLDK